VLLNNGEVRLAGEVEDLLAEHRLLVGPAAEASAYAKRMAAVQVSQTEAQAHLLVRSNSPIGAGWESHPVSLEELTLAYLRAPAAQSIEKEAA
jgi:ABC-2 type transport system ATP-binding protein